MALSSERRGDAGQADPSGKIWIPIAALAAQLASPLSTSRSLVQLAEGPAGARPLFLVHPIGGHVYFYLPLAGQLSDFVPVYGLQAQGVDGEAPPIETIEEMATGYIAAMRQVTGYTA